MRTDSPAGLRDGAHSWRSRFAYAALTPEVAVPSSVRPAVVSKLTPTSDGDTGAMSDLTPLTVIEMTFWATAWQTTSGIRATIRLVIAEM